MVIRIVFLLIVHFFLLSCTVTSTQFDYLASLVKPENENSPKKNWQMKWSGNEKYLYAVNLKDQIVFTDNSVFIYFMNDQIYKVEGILPNESLIEIVSKNDFLVYKVDGVEISQHNCTNMNEVESNGLREFHQLCIGAQSEGEYKNQIHIDSNNMINKLYFKIHPNYPILELGIKQTIGYNSNN